LEDLQFIAFFYSRHSYHPNLIYHQHYYDPYLVLETDYQGIIKETLNYNHFNDHLLESMHFITIVDQVYHIELKNSHLNSNSLMTYSLNLHLTFQFLINFYHLVMSFLLIILYRYFSLYLNYRLNSQIHHRHRLSL